MQKGLVIKAISGLFTVVSDKKEYNCRASTKLKLNKQKIITGDYVMFNPQEEYIYELLVREHELIRPKLANVEKIMLIFSIVEPDFNFGLLDRMLLVMEENKLESSIVVTKLDLVGSKEKEALSNKLEYYHQIGYDIYYTDTDIEGIKDHLGHDKYVLTGQSGVGKSTLINTLIPDLNLKTNEISNALGRGKHTTRQVTFFDYKEGYIIDTPGFSALDLPLNQEIVRDNYVDFKRLSSDCKFSNCYHLNEPNCAVKNLLGENETFDLRYKNYQRIQQEIKETR